VVARQLELMRLVVAHGAVREDVAVRIVELAGGDAAEIPPVVVAALQLRAAPKAALERDLDAVVVAVELRCVRQDGRSW
jgi:hypothetical protein